MRAVEISDERQALMSSPVRSGNRLSGLPTGSPNNGGTSGRGHLEGREPETLDLRAEQEVPAGADEDVGPVQMGHQLLTGEPPDDLDGSRQPWSRAEGCQRCP